MEIEICTASHQSVCNAIAGGAYRVELCSQLQVGGLTPSMEEVDFCVKKGLHTRVLIRPRGGDFAYSDDEYEQMLKDIDSCKRLGAKAVVVGFLNEDGTINEERTREAVLRARPMEVTFHRAIDECKDPLVALEQIIACGCDKILTSGHEPTAEQGMDMLKKMVAQAQGRIAIIAASGVSGKNAKRIAENTGVMEVHGSCKTTLADGTTETSAEAVRELMSNK